MPELTITLPYVYCSMGNPMRESTLSPSTGLRMWPLYTRKLEFSSSVFPANIWLKFSTAWPRVSLRFCPWLILNLTRGVLSVSMMCSSGEIQWTRGSFLLTNSILSIFFAIHRGEGDCIEWGKPWLGSGPGNSGFSHVGKCLKKSHYRTAKTAHKLQTSWLHLIQNRIYSIYVSFKSRQHFYQINENFPMV